MLQIEYQKWGQTPEDLLRLGLESTHTRTRERFLALYEVTQGCNATVWSERSRRHHQTVQAWIHRYNEGGPKALTYARTGGRPPFAQPSSRFSIRRSGKPSMSLHAL